MTSRARRHIPTILHIALLAGVYYGTARLGLWAGFLKGNVTAIWPPTGIALAALVLWGSRVWPGVFLGALLVNGLSPVPIGSAFGMAAGNTLEALAGAWMLRRAGFRPSLQRVRDIVLLTFFGAALSTIASATIGVGSLVLGGVTRPAAAWQTWKVWWIGDAIGDLVVAPAVFAFVAGRTRSRRAGSTVEAAFLFGLMAASSVIVFSHSTGRPFLLFPLFIWAAVRFSRRGAAVATFIVAIVATIRTAGGVGPFAASSPSEGLAFLDTYIAMSAVTAFVLAAIVSERDRAESELLEINASLDAAVREQTEELRTDRRRLAEAQRLANLGSWEWDVTTDIVTWSDQLYRLFGHNAGEFQVTFGSYLASVHPSDRSLAERVVDRALRDLTPFDFEHRIVLPSGEVRWLHGTGEVQAGPDGAPYKMSGTSHDITERKRAEEALAYHAGHDTLTNLPNRVLFLDRLSQALARRVRTPSTLAVLFLDVDHFKWLNDSLGHKAGDRLLVEISQRLQSVLRPGDTTARFGGDEFIVLAEDLTGEPEALAVAQRFSRAISAPLILDGKEIIVTASIGIAIARDDDTTADELLRDADSAMYQAKERGRDRFEIFHSAMRAQANERLERSQSLRRAIEHEELTVHYQPEIHLESNRVTGVEALVRWNDPERGLVMPDDFIPRAEETNLIIPLGIRVLSESCRQMAAWQRDGVFASDATVSVNLSARQLAAPDLSRAVVRALDEAGLPAQNLCLEITESLFVEDTEPFIATLRLLKDLGVKIGVDDFGTGFSSLRYLKRFEVDMLKVDRSFVEGVTLHQRDRSIVTSVIGLARAFELTTIAEGVETVEQLSMLRSMGCDVGQGFLWSPALPAGEVEGWMAGRSPRRQVLIVDEDPARRARVRAALDGNGVFHVGGEATTGAEAVVLARRCNPDIVLLGHASDADHAVPLIIAASPSARIIATTPASDGVFEWARSRQIACIDADASDLAARLTPLLAG